MCSRKESALIKKVNRHIEHPWQTIEGKVGEKAGPGNTRCLSSSSDRTGPGRRCAGMPPGSRSTPCHRAHHFRIRLAKTAVLGRRWPGSPQAQVIPLIRAGLAERPESPRDGVFFRQRAYN